MFISPHALISNENLCTFLLADLGQRSNVCVCMFYQGFQKEPDFETSNSHIILGDGHCRQDIEARAVVSKHAGSCMHSTVSTSFWELWVRWVHCLIMTHWLTNHLIHFQFFSSSP